MLRRTVALLPEVAAFAVIVAALAARAAYLGAPQLYRDEAASWYLASRPLDGLLAQSAHETFPPLYLFLLKGWMGVFGDSEAALRSLSVLCWLGLVAATYGFARAAVGRWAGLAATLIVALSPAILANSLSARMYTLEALFATLAWWLVWWLVAAGGAWSPKRRAAALVALALLAAAEVWTMSLGVPLVGLQVAFAAAAWIRRRDRLAVAALAALALGALTLVPWLPNLVSIAGNGQSFWTGRPDPATLWQTVLGWFAAGSQPGAAVVALAATALASIGLWSLLRPEGSNVGLAGDRRLLALALVLGVALVPAVWLYSQFRSIYDPRYLGACLPPFAILVAGGLGRLDRSSPARTTRFGRAAAPLIAAALVVAMAAGNAVTLDRFRSGQDMDPAREVVETLAAEVRPGDVVLTLNAQSYFPLEYYLVRPGLAARLGVELYHWHRPTAAFFTGWRDIDPGRVIDRAKVDALGWAGAVGLQPSARIWLVTVTDPDYEFPLFEPAQTGDLRVHESIAVTGAGGTAMPAEIWLAVPARP